MSDYDGDIEMNNTNHTNEIIKDNTDNNIKDKEKNNKEHNKEHNKYNTSHRMSKKLKKVTKSNNKKMFKIYDLFNKLKL